jgi:signal peptide peptidase SppA
MPSHSALHARLGSLIGRPLLMTPQGAEQLANLFMQALPEGNGSASGGVRPDQNAFFSEPPPPPPGGHAYVPMWLGEPDDELEWGMALKDGVATLKIDTPLFAEGEAWWGHWYHGYDSLQRAISNAMEDPRVEGIFVHIDSPGGVVHDGLYQLSELMRETRAGNGGKPIHVHGELIASAAYWIGSQADRITASRTAAVGSIGAVMLHHDVSGAMEKWGIRVTPIQGGRRKTEFASFHGLDEEAIANLQAMIDQVYRDFVRDVNVGRPSLDEGALYETEARLFDARNDLADHSGLDHGLIDAIETEEAAFDQLRALISKNTPAAGSTPTIDSQSRERNKENAMSSTRKALAALSGDGKATDRIAAAIELLPKGSAARGILLGSGATETRISRAKVKLAEQLDDENANEDPDPDANDDPDNSTNGEGNDPDPDAEDGPDPDAEDEPDPDAEDEPDPDAEDDPDPDAEDEPDDEMARAQAILDLPEARGCEALARKLAFQKGMTVANAKDLLATAPKGGRRKVEDPNISGNAGGGGNSASPDDRLVQSSLKLREQRGR